MAATTPTAFDSRPFGEPFLLACIYPDYRQSYNPTSGFVQPLNTINGRPRAIKSNDEIPGMLLFSNLCAMQYRTTGHWRCTLSNYGRPGREFTKLLIFDGTTGLVTSLGAGLFRHIERVTATFDTPHYCNGCTMDRSRRETGFFRPITPSCRLACTGQARKTCL